MRPFFVLSLVCFSMAVLAQAPVYQSHEVQTPAQPKGGFAFLQQFVNSNLQPPLFALVRGIKGRVFIKGIIEADGTPTDIVILKGLHPSCDAEVLRVLRLFKAWQPAQKDGQNVRQAINYLVMFPEKPVINYDSTQQATVYYFDKAFKPTTDPTAYQYRQVTPLDSNGWLRADVTIDQYKRNKWTELIRAPYKRKPYTYKYATDTGMDSVAAYHTSARDAQWNDYVPERITTLDGQLLSETEYNGMTPIRQTLYFKNGPARKQTAKIGDVTTDIYWHENGQIAKVTETKQANPLSKATFRVANLWRKDGTQLVENGNGYAYYQREGEGSDYKKDAQNVPIFEQGRVANGKKEGRWTGKLPDSTLVFDELYEGDSLISGTAFYDGKAVSYTEQEHQPEFKGGISGLMNFLGQNIRYPAKAARNNISGKVFLTFVVCQDGTLCDYELLKGVGGGCDEEALRVVKNMSGLWLPGVQRGRKVRVKYNLPVSFVLSN